MTELLTGEDARQGDRVVSQLDESLTGIIIDDSMYDDIVKVQWENSELTFFVERKHLKVLQTAFEMAVEHVPSSPKGAKQVSIHVQIESLYDLPGDDVFPDGIPNPTGWWSADTLATSLKLRYRYKPDFLHDMSMLDNSDIVITVTDDQGRTAEVKIGDR